jgi:excisionase family DNA binding protein
MCDLSTFRKGNTTMDELFTLQELAEYLKIAEKTLYGYAQKGTIPGIRIGSAWRFRKTDIENWLDDLRRLTEQSYYKSGDEGKKSKDKTEKQ